MFAAVPLVTFLSLAIGPFLLEASGAFVVGAVAIASGLGLIQAAHGGSFRQQFGFILLAIGIGLVVFGLFRDLPIAAAGGLTVLLTAGLSVVSGQRWINLLLGVGGLLGASAFVFGLMAGPTAPVAGVDPETAMYLQTLVTGSGYRLIALAVLAAVLLVGLRALRDAGGGSFDRSLVGGLDGFVTGFAGALLLRAMSGSPTFLIAPGNGMTFTGGLPLEFGPDLGRILAVCALVAALGLSFGFVRPLERALQTSAGLAVAAAAVVLTYVMAMLAVPLLVLLAAIAGGRRGLTVLSAVAAIWVIGSFMYWIGVPLYLKGLILMALGGCLGGLLWWQSGQVRARLGGLGEAARNAAGVLARDEREGLGWWPTSAGIVLSVALLGWMVGSGIHASEALIAHGRPVFVRLAPVDPRSLMQGDYMQLAFEMPRLVRRGRDDAPLPEWAIAEVDDRNVARIDRLAAEPADAEAGEISLRLHAKQGRPILGTDGFYFAEGAGERYERARYGLFKVGTDGRVILVGLADEALTVIE